jgi:hypothetical protein
MAARLFMVARAEVIDPSAIFVRLTSVKPRTVAKVWSLKEP